MNRSKILAVLVAVCCLAAGGVAVAGAIGVPHDPRNEPQLSAAQLHTPQPDVLDRFSVLQRARTAADDVATVMQPESLPVAATTARRLSVRATRADAWLLGDADQLCLSVHAAAGGAGATCNRTATSKSGFAMTLGGGSGNAEVLVVGVVPDGVDSVDLRLRNGKVLPLAVSDNAYSAVVTTPTDSVRFVAANGERYVWPVPSYNE